MARASDHPLPQRIFHYVNLIGMLLLIVTGVMLHQPPAGVSQALVRAIHLPAGMVVLMNLLVRVYYAFFGRYRDAHTFAFGLRDIPGAARTFYDYVTFKGSTDRSLGYNPLQRLSYLIVAALILLQGLLGLALWWPDTFAGGVILFGGLTGVRTLHYAFTYLFVVFIVTHAYLVIADERDELRLMFIGNAGGEQADRKNPGSGDRQHSLAR